MPKKIIATIYFNLFIVPDLKFKKKGNEGLSDEVTCPSRPALLSRKPVVDLNWSVSTMQAASCDTVSLVPAIVTGRA